MSRVDRNSLLKQAPAAGLAVVLLASGVIVATSGDGGSDYVVTAVMKDSAGLRKNSDVKVGGVAAGTITKLDLDKADHAVVTMKLDSGAYPIGAGASAAVRPVNLLGEKYVDLSPGDLTKPVRSGTTIGLARTSQPVELDDVLNTLDASVRGRLRVLINEVGIGLGGQGTDLNATLKRLPPALDQTQEVVSSFAADNQRLRDAITQGDTTLATFAKGKDDLTALVDSAQRTLRVTTENRDALGRTIGDTPATLSQLRTTLAKLQTTSQRLKPAAVQIQRSSAPLTAALDQLPGFVHAAEPTLKKAKAVAPVLGRLGTRGTPVLKRVTPVADQLDRFAVTLDPLSRTLDHETNPLLRLMEGWARTTQIRDNAGHLFRTEVTVDQELLQQLLTTTAAKKPGAGNKRIPDPLDPAPAPGSKPFPLAAREGAKATPPPAATADPPAGTGTTPSAPAAPKADDSRSLLDYLLGG